MTAAIAGGALLGAAGGAGVSFAWFGGTSSSEANSATAATIELTGIDPSANNVLPPDPYAIVRPGGPDATGVQPIGNGGNVGANLTVRVSQIDQLTANNLSSVLRLSVDECTTGTGQTCGTPVSRYDGPIASATSAISLGSLTAQGTTGDSKRIRIRVYWRRADDNTALHNDRMGFRLSWQLRTAA